MRKQVKNQKFEDVEKNMWRRFEKTGSIVDYVLFVSKFDYFRRLELFPPPSK